MDPSTRLRSPTRKGCWLRSSSVHPDDEDRKAPLVTKPYGAQTQQLFHKKDELGQILSSVTICMNKTLLHTYATCVTFDDPQNNLYIFIYV